jgi:NAD(P)-dependent dehydrogenase (short-subunit alcohol dehydrogenase family)
MEMKKLQDKVALITGGNAGLGRATALLFAEEGAKVVIAARREKESMDVVQAIREAGGSAIFVKADVRKADDCRCAVESAVEVFGKLDIAFNNAGVLAFGKTVVEMEESTWDTVLDINLKGIWLCMKYEIPAMLKGGGGAIVNMSSTGGLVGSALGIGAYHASKHGVIGLSKAAACEYATQNIRVNTVCPGVSVSDMTDEWFKGNELRGAFEKAHPVGRLGTPMDTARAALFLASADSAYMTGVAIPIDGGYVVP